MKKVSRILGLYSSNSSDNRVIAGRHCGDLKRGIVSEQFPVFVQELTQAFLHRHFFTEKEAVDQIFLRLRCKCT